MPELSVQARVPALTGLTILAFDKIGGAGQQNLHSFYYTLKSHLIENLADSQEQYQMAFIKCQYTDDYLLTLFLSQHVFIIVFIFLFFS